MQSKTIQFDTIGEIYIFKSGRSKRMSLKVHPIKGICVSIPKYWSYKNAEVLLKENKNWVENSVKRLKSNLKKTVPFTSDKLVKTKFHEVKILPSLENKLDFVLKGTLLTIFYPKNEDIQKNEIQAFIRFQLEELYRKEAKQYLPQRVDELAKEQNFTYRKVKIKNMKSRWGSCSFNNTINLSLHIMRLPNHLCDYILLHELCHTVHKNHSKDFWNLLSSICPSAKVKDREMRNYDANIY